MIHTKLHVDLAWLNRVSMSLERFKKVKTDTFNCRCPICGDSKKSAKAARFYFYAKKGKLNAFCHNCGYSHSFFVFMKDAFPSHFEEYKRETLFDAFKQSQAPRQSQQPILEQAVTVSKGIAFDDFKRMTTCIADLSDTHFAKQFLVDRAFSEKELRRLYFVSDFKMLASVMNAEASEKLIDGEPRVVIPFVTRVGYVEMMQGRDLLGKNAKVKYLSIKAHDDVDKIYGLYELDDNRTSYCVEGPLDSLFVDNCVASCDANLTRVKADVYIWDCQARNKEVCRYMEEAIEAGKAVVIWPFAASKKLDINDMIKAGVSREQLMKTIRDNTFSGLTAKVKFMQWKKV